MTDRSPDISRRRLLGALAAVPVVGAAAIAEEAMIGIENLLPGEFTWHPERSPDGAVAIIVSIPEQRVHVYRNGIRIAVSTCSTGKPGHETPTGVFTVLQKDKHHHSSTYNNASMPNMNRLTWDGIALHAGNLPGYPASHGCVRLPLDFSAKLFGITHVGTPVILAGAAGDPWSLVHPGLMLGQDADAEETAAVAGLKPKARPTDWVSASDHPVTTVLATGQDRMLHLIENGEVLLSEPMTLKGAGPLGEHVFVLNGAAEGGAGFHWTGITHHPDPSNPIAPEVAVLDRIDGSRNFADQMRARVHAGMVMVVSDVPSTPDRRSGEDFVIMDGELLTSPVPKGPPPVKVDQG